MLGFVGLRVYRCSGSRFYGCGLGLPRLLEQGFVVGWGCQVRRVLKTKVRKCLQPGFTWHYGAMAACMVR